MTRSTNQVRTLVYVQCSSAEGYYQCPKNGGKEVKAPVHVPSPSTPTTNLVLAEFTAGKSASGVWYWKAIINNNIGHQLQRLFREEDDGFKKAIDQRAEWVKEFGHYNS